MHARPHQRRATTYLTFAYDLMMRDTCVERRRKFFEEASIYLRRIVNATHLARSSAQKPLECSPLETHKTTV